MQVAQIAEIRGKGGACGEEKDGLEGESKGEFKE